MVVSQHDGDRRRRPRRIRLRPSCELRIGHESKLHPATAERIPHSPTNRSEDYGHADAGKHGTRRRIELNIRDGSAARPRRGIACFDVPTRDRRLPELGRPPVSGGRRPTIGLCEREIRPAGMVREHFMPRPQRWLLRQRTRTHRPSSHHHKRLVHPDHIAAHPAHHARHPPNYSARSRGRHPYFSA